MSALSSNSLTNGSANPAVIAERIAKHLFNYVSSFGTGANVTPSTMVPMDIIAKWYESVINKIRTGNIGFLERQE